MALFRCLMRGEGFLDILEGRDCPIGLYVNRPVEAVDDAAHRPVLLDQISTPIASSMGDDAFDTGAVHAADIFGNPDARVIVPPGKDAVLNLNAATAPTQRDKHVMKIKAHGR